MTELPKPLHKRINKLCKAGDDAAQAEDYDDAIAEYKKAWELIPIPREDWEMAAWILTAMGDTYFLAGDYAAGSGALNHALRCFGAEGNPFLHLRLGQCAYQLKQLDAAEKELARAFAVAGQEIFEDEDEVYSEFLKSRTKA